MSRTAKAWHRPEWTAKNRGRSQALGCGVALVVSAAFAASFGFNFGAGNQLTYLPQALHLLEPGLLARDWFVTQTTQYHPVFAYLGAALLALHRDGWGVALGLTFAVTAGGMALHALVRQLGGFRVGLPAFLLVMLLAFVTRTEGPAVTYVFDSTLQPSTLSSAFFLAASAAFVAGRLGLSGLLLAASGLFHLNLLVLLVPAFALGTLLLGPEARPRRLLAVLAPSALPLAVFAPSLMRASASGPSADFARHVFVALRLPHHHVLTSVVPFLPLLAWLVMAAGVGRAYAGREDEPEFRRCFALIGGIVAVIGSGTLAGLSSERWAVVFAWRLVPHVELLLAAYVVSALLRALLEPDRAPALPLLTKIGLALGASVLLAGYAAHKERAAVAVVAVLVVVCAFRWLRPRRSRLELLALAFAVLLVLFALGSLRGTRAHSNLLAPRPRSLVELETWLRERSPSSALFLTPPDEESLRFRGERAIVVDWKANPAVPSEILAWYRRLGDVVGRAEFRGAPDLRAYDELDEERLARLHAEYGFDFVVVRRPAAGRLPRHARVFENAAYSVLRAGER